MLQMLLAVTLAAAQSPPDAPAPESDASTASGRALTKEKTEAMLAKCGARRFQTSALRVVEGRKRQTRITLCAADGESEAEWITKLEQSAKSVETLNLPNGAKAKLIGELRAEIARVKALRPVTPAEPVQTIRTALPPPLLPVQTRPTRSLAQDYAALPPLPPPLSPTRIVAASPAVASPGLTIRCAIPSEGQGEGVCDSLMSHTVVSVRAGAPLAGDWTMRFMRKDRPRGDISLAGLRGARSMRVKLPAQVCSGVVRSEVTIQILANAAAGLGQVAQSFGPMSLRC